MLFTKYREKKVTEQSKREPWRDSRTNLEILYFDWFNRDIEGKC